MPISLEAPTRLSVVIRGVISTSARLLVVGAALPVLGSASIVGPQVARNVGRGGRERRFCAAEFAVGLTQM